MQGVKFISVTDIKTATGGNMRRSLCFPACHSSSATPTAPNEDGCGLRRTGWSEFSTGQNKDKGKGVAPSWVWTPDWTVARFAYSRVEDSWTTADCGVRCAAVGRDWREVEVEFSCSGFTSKLLCWWPILCFSLPLALPVCSRSVSVLFLWHRPNWGSWLLNRAAGRVKPSFLCFWWDESTS